MLSDKLQEQQDKYIESYDKKIKGAKDFRIDVIAKLIIDGVRPFEIIKFCAEKFGYSSRNAEKYMKLARLRLNEINSPALEDNLAVAITQINDLINESRKDKDENGKFDRKEVLDYIMAKARLQGLLNKIDISGKIDFTLTNVTEDDMKV